MEPTDQESGLLNHYTKQSTASGRHRKACNSRQSCLTGSSLFDLVHLIKQI